MNLSITYNDYEFMGAHLVSEHGNTGVRFSVWAPHAASVRIVGHFNNWHGHNHTMHKKNVTGIWSIFVQGLHVNSVYMYEIITQTNKQLHKIDPYAFYMGISPDFTCKVTDLSQFEWLDNEWQKSKSWMDKWNRPISIYEVHPGSWRRHSDGKYFSYIELAHSLVGYVKEMGFTHIQLMPVMEHPFDGSWGYQCTGYFAANSRFGHPIDLMYFIDYCHQHNIGVILDWVPGHFSRDRHGIAWFDGEKCYELNSTKRGSANKWGANDFDLQKSEVQRFLISSALFWIDKFHADGLRVDAVSEMVHNNGFHFLKKLNTVVNEKFPGTLMIAEDSSGRREVTENSEKGLGFTYRWNMWWAHDILNYMKHKPSERKHHHKRLMCTLEYAHIGNFILSLSHDETAFSRGSLLEKMPGNATDRLSNLKLLIAWQMVHPGKKLIFMGIESAQSKSWNQSMGIDWNRLKLKKIKYFQSMVKYLNDLYSAEPALNQLDRGGDGTVIQSTHAESATVVFRRIGRNSSKCILVAANFSDESIKDFFAGVSEPGNYKLIFSTDGKKFGGNTLLYQTFPAEQCHWQEQPFRIKFDLPKLTLMMIQKCK
ncbi:MAG TPA: 1,4-alpha-glucan branching protein GlgB [Victivallales bacterium]|nr:1,4-alpha-glucan branching protein GlgB [Victivallales bacterium]